MIAKINADTIVIFPRSGATIFAGYVSVALFFVPIWIKWGLGASMRAFGRQTIFQAGHRAVCANAVLLYGMGLSLQAASISKEEEGWCALYMMDYLAPAAALPAAIGLTMIHLGRGQADSAPEMKSPGPCGSEGYV